MIKIVSFFEEHIEKIILAAVGLVCLWLLVTHVLLDRPNAVSLDNRKFKPGTIDNYISKEADILKQKLDQPPTAALLEPNKPTITLKGFTALLDSAVRGVDTGVYLPQPYSISGQRYANKKGEYRLPDIGEVSDVAVERIRAVAYVPIEEITEQSIYDKVGHEPNDIDLVTVEAKFDAAGLYQRFNECFAGDDVTTELRDPCLARPVFAAVQLQRQELNPDGSWSNWQTVPRIKIDHLRKLFEVIEDTDKLPAGGIKVRMVQFDNREVMMDLLQPLTYQIASAKQEWYPPSLHKKFVELQNQQQIEERRKAQEEEKKAREEKLQQQRTGTPGGRLGEGPGGAYYEDLAAMETVTGSRTRTTRRSTSERLTDRGLSSDRGRLTDSDRSRDSGRLRESGRLTDSGRPTDSGRRPARGEQGGADERQIEKERLARAKELSTKQAMNDIYNELSKILITPVTDLSRMREPLVFWAHDDTAEPEKTYRYRIRLGVFNPMAGASGVAQQDKSAISLADKSRVKNAILWSEFSSPSATVEIPGVLYFFAKGIQEAAKKVTVQVCKYAMGYWHSEDFLVGQGEVIGKPVESKPPAPAPMPRPVGVETGASRGGRAEANPRIPTYRESSVGQPLYGTGPDTVLPMPETIDYTTGAVLVDVVPVNDWSGGGGKSMFARHYFDMLYSFDGTNIEHTPVDMKYWATDLRTVYGEIQNLQKEPREPLRAWGGQDTGFRRVTPSPLYEGYDERMMEEEMMMEKMRRGEGRMR